MSDAASPVQGRRVGWWTLFRKWFTDLASPGERSGDTGPSRVYPQIADIALEVTLPISFVVIRFSDEYRHNFLVSPSAQDPINEVIEVDNSSNLYFDNLSQAIAAGLNRANNDIIAVIHEDVLLPQGWQAQFQQTLSELEEHDPSWGMLGSVGWDAEGRFVGHWSDPHQFKNTFADSERNFQEVVKLDEQLLIFHRQRAPALDTHLPGIHFLGEDLKHELAGAGLRTYAINAPTIHKFADKHGDRIVSSIQSDKISDRESATYLADEACCKDYVSWKYPALFPAATPVPVPAALNDHQRLQLQRPVIILCKGELECALVSELVRDCGVVVPEEPAAPGQPPALMIAIYKMIIEKFRCHAPWQAAYTQERLLSIAAPLLGNLQPGQHWALAFPESNLILPELSRVFPDARYLCVHRDPLDICLGASDKSARLDNHIGRIALPEAYSHLGLERAQILQDDELDHRVYTTIHQLGLLTRHLAAPQRSDPLFLAYTELQVSPVSARAQLSGWLGEAPPGPAFPSARRVDSQNENTGRYSAARIAAAAEQLQGVRAALGYI